MRICISLKMVAAGRLMVLFAAVLMSVAIVEAADDSYMKVRTKRNLMGLGKMIGSATGKDLMSVAITYNGYGCYCGLGGKGTPVDGVDRCCQAHDSCFTIAQKGICSTSKKTIYSQSYEYKSKDRDRKDGVRAEIKCAAVSDYKKESPAQALCSKSICECDRALATCLAEHKPSNKFVRYDRSKCK